MTDVLAGVVLAPRRLWRGFAGWLHDRMPKGLYARSLLIVILPILLLQSAVAYVFMERHWEVVTYRLSAATARDVAAVVDLYRNLPRGELDQTLMRVARDDLFLPVFVLPKQPLPKPVEKPFFSLLDMALSKELAKRIPYKFWVDTQGRSAVVEIRVEMEDATLQMLATRAQAYASNSHIFFLWMVVASVVILAIATSFLRNQIKPILRLAQAAEEFGKGREVEFRPRGAREVRRAGAAFLEMKRRVARSVEQRAAMLDGVARDLRAIVTRFRVSLAQSDDSPQVSDMRKDVEDMERMVEAYLTFARGDGGESSAPTDISTLFADLESDTRKIGLEARSSIAGSPVITARPQAIRRLLANLVGNAQRHAQVIDLSAVNDGATMTICVDDDGPGVPVELREDVFRPLFRRESAKSDGKNASAGIGLAMARDIARTHGGDITLDRSPLGGLRAKVVLPI